MTNSSGLPSLPRYQANLHKSSHSVTGCSCHGKQFENCQFVFRSIKLVYLGIRVPPIPKKDIWSYFRYSAIITWGERGWLRADGRQKGSRDRPHSALAHIWDNPHFIIIIIIIIIHHYRRSCFGQPSQSIISQYNQILEDPSDSDNSEILRHPGGISRSLR